MTEGPGLGGFPDAKPPGTRAPKAYSNMLRAFWLDLPTAIRSANRTRAQIRRLGARKKG